MTNSIQTMSFDEVDIVSGAGEAGRKAGEAVAEFFDASPEVVEAAGTVGSAIEDGIKNLLS